MKKLILLVLLISSSSHVFSQQVCKGTDCKGLVKGDVLVSLDEVEASLFCNNELPIVPSELSGFTCRYNGNAFTNPTFISRATDPKIPQHKSNIDVKTLPKAWILKVVSTKKSSKADEFVEVLKGLNIRSYTEKVRVDGQDLHNVYVGPKLDKRRTLADKELIDKSLGTTSLILEYNP
tara:strand:- start:943 stop:1476 length:534 start_codon:yes stop_codon:yes gene_type:complete